MFSELFLCQELSRSKDTHEIRGFCDASLYLGITERFSCMRGTQNSDSNANEIRKCVKLLHYNITSRKVDFRARTRDP